MYKLALAAASLAPFVKAQGACDPEQIMINYGSDSTSMWISYATPCDQADSAVSFGLSKSSLSNTVATAPGSTYTMGSYTSPYLYHGLLTGLKTNTVYYYTVGGSAGTSQVYNFTSHPGLSVPLTFGIIGDLGQTSNSQGTLDHVLANPQISSIFHVGDLSYADGDEPRWDSWGNLVQQVTTSTPYHVAVGNHELNDDSGRTFTAYKQRFRVPDVAGKQELYYSVDVGYVHWVMVAGYCENKSQQPCVQAGSAQNTWLSQDLANVDRTKTPFVIVTFHQPYASSNKAHFGEGQVISDAMEDIFYQNNVDLIFSGHVHAYERCAHYYKNKVDPNGPVYITIGDGGNREGLATTWNSPQPDWSLFRMASYGHGELAVNATAMHWTWHQNSDLEPSVGDEVIITKTNMVGKYVTPGEGITVTPKRRDGKGLTTASEDIPIEKLAKKHSLRK
jgi:acid phosphatase type 7